MATSPSTERPAAAVPRQGALAWALLALGVAAAIGWVLLGQTLGETIALEEVGAAVSLYYALLFVPLLIVAFLLGYLGHIKVWRLGEAPGRWALIGLALGTGGLLTTIGYAWLNGGLVQGAEASAAMGFVLLALTLTILQVGTEELLFRGWLQPALVARLGPLPGIALGAAVFAAFHLSAGVQAPLSLLNLLLGGVWFGLLAWRSQGLVAPFMAHFSWNAIEDVGFGLVPNPGTGALGALFDTDLAGALLWGGSEDGLNASLGTSVVLIALILPLLRRRAAASTVPA